MGRRRLSLRGRVFLGGVFGSIALVGLFFGLAFSPVAHSRAGNIAGLEIIRLFEWSNPLLLLLERISRKLWGPAPPGGARQMLLIVIDVILFFGWWWAIGIAVDRLVARRRTAVGGA